MAGPLKITVKGQREMEAKLAGVVKNFPERVSASLFKRLEKVMTKSKRDFVPVDLGNLRDTGIVEKPVVSGNKISVTLAYGGPAVDYAAEQHEFHRDKSQYLKKPMDEATSTLASDIAKDLKL